MPIGLAKRPTSTALGRATDTGCNSSALTGEMALWRFRPLSRSGGHPHSFLENTYLLESEAYAAIEQLILGQLPNVLGKCMKINGDVSRTGAGSDLRRATDDDVSD